MNNKITKNKKDDDITGTNSNYTTQIPRNQEIFI